MNWGVENGITIPNIENKTKNVIPREFIATILAKKCFPPYCTSPTPKSIRIAPIK